MKKLIIIITSVLFLSGCITKKQFHNTYGFADENKQIYNQDMINCKQYSYDTYPPKTFSMPTYYNPNTYANVGGIGGAMEHHKDLLIHLRSMLQVRLPALWRLPMQYSH